MRVHSFCICAPCSVRSETAPAVRGLMDTACAAVNVMFKALSDEELYLTFAFVGSRPLCKFKYCASFSGNEEVKSGMSK